MIELQPLNFSTKDNFEFGTQSVMPFGTPDQVKRTVKEMIELFASGLVLATTHVLEPYVPWQNIVAFFEALEEFGRFS